MLRLVGALFVLATGLMGCDLERQRLFETEYPSYSEHVRRVIAKESIMRGMTENQVYLPWDLRSVKRTSNFKEDRYKSGYTHQLGVTPV
ncbi:hypothetical protein [Nitrospira sp. Nam80]